MKTTPAKKLKGVLIKDVSVTDKSVTLLGADGYMYVIQWNDYENPLHPNFEVKRYKEVFYKVPETRMKIFKPASKKTEK